MARLLSFSLVTFISILILSTTAHSKYTISQLTKLRIANDRVSAWCTGDNLCGGLVINDDSFIAWSKDYGPGLDDEIFLATTVVVLDSDKDGLPDEWEKANGLDPLDDGSTNPINGPSGDPDNDGFDNITEHNSGSDPQNSDSLPVDTAITLYKGYNLIGWPVTEQGGLTSYALLSMLGNTEEIDKILIHDKNAAHFKETYYTGSDPAGDDVDVTSTDGIIVYSNVEKTLVFNPVDRPFNSFITCPSVNLTGGTNMAADPCAPSGYTSYQLVSDMGGASYIPRIQRFNPETGKFDTAGYMNGQPSGVDYPIRAGEGYILLNGVSLNYPRSELEARWRLRIQSFLDAGIIPLIEIESSLKKEDGDLYLSDVLPVMDSKGVALIAFDGYQAPKLTPDQEGYRWSYYIHTVVNKYPGRFILATNGGTNNNWFQGKSSYISQLEQQVRSDEYPLIGEIEFRHYMSSAQCASGMTDRDINIPLNSANGHRVFSLSRETGVPFLVHLEPEDALLSVLEEMLQAYPNAKIIVAHFGQIRHPEKQMLFGPDLVRRLLTTYPNLYYDISTGEPGRTYACNNNVLDTVIWQDDGFGSQTDTLKPAYQSILNDFSGRFVTGFDYGGNRGPLSDFISARAGNARLIMRDLSTDAKHNISYRNAWRLLTGDSWQEH